MRTINQFSLLPIFFISFSYSLSRLLIIIENCASSDSNLTTNNATAAGMREIINIESLSLWQWDKKSCFSGCSHNSFNYIANLSIGSQTIVDGSERSHRYRWQIIRKELAQITTLRSHLPRAICKTFDEAQLLSN
jgi:hypothetical protein